MAVVVIITSHAPSLINFRFEFISLLISRGHQVFAIAPNVDLSIRSQLESVSARVVEIPLSRVAINPLKDLNSLLRIIQALSSIKPDICFSYFAKPVIYGSIAARIAGVPSIFAMIEGLGGVFADSGRKPSVSIELKRTIIKCLYRISLSRVSRVVFLNNDDCAEFVEWKIVSPKEAFVLGGIGVDLEYWKPAEQHYDIPAFVMAARLIREKGVEEFMQAAKIIKGSFPSSQFFLLGGLDITTSSFGQCDLDDWIKEGVVNICGHVDARNWIRCGGVFVLPSYYREGVPRSIQEAMAAGMPIITTDVPGCRETVLHGVNGFLVPPRNSSALAKAMERFIRQPDLVETMGRESRRIAEERFDVHRANARLMEVMAL